MTSVEDTFLLLGADGRVTYTTYASLPTNVYQWDYWAKDQARSHFRFELVPVGEGIRIYIVAQPPYQGRPTDSISTHRYQNENGRYYICVSRSSQPQTVAEAMTWYSYWSERTVEYIATGRAFS